MSRRSRASLAIGGFAIGFGAVSVYALSDEYGYVGAVGFVCALYAGLALFFGVLWHVIGWIDRGST